MRQYLSLIFGLLLAISACVIISDSALAKSAEAMMVQSAQPIFKITIKSNPTTGYSWFLKQYNSKLVQPITHQYYPSKKKLAGAGGNEVWTFKIMPDGFIVPHVIKIVFAYARPWEKEIGKSRSFMIFTH